MEERGDQRVQVYRGAAEFLAGINLSSREQWNFELKTAAAAERRGDPCDLYRIRSAARDHLAA